MGKPDDVTEHKLKTNDDYTTELPKASKSMKAARAGDDAASTASQTPSQFRLPPIELNPEHSLEKEEWFRSHAQAYQRGHHRTDTASYRDLVAQADGYRGDASNITNASAAYNELVPQASLALDSVIRFKTIQEELGSKFDDTVSLDAANLNAVVADRAPELAGAMSAGDIKTNKGQVSDAARGFSAAQHKLYSAMHKMNGLQLRTVIKKLEAEKREKSEQKEAIERSIESAHRLTETVTGVLGFTGEAAVGPRKVHEHDPIARTEGTFESGNVAVEAAGAVIGAGMYMLHDQELHDIQAQITSLSTQIAATQRLEEAKEVSAIEAEFTGARLGYTAALKHYENAIASRRTAYSKAGARADKRHGGNLKKGGDKASQTMLFVSAARETNIILQTALSTGLNADKSVRTALRGMEHRGRSFLLDDWEMKEGEGTNTPDRNAVFKAFSLTDKWITATKKEVSAFQRLEEASEEMLQTSGKTSGEY